MNAMSAIDKHAKDSQKLVGDEYSNVHGDEIINTPPNALVEKLYSADLQDIEDPGVKTILKTVENRLKRNGIVKSEPSVGPDGSYNYDLTGKGMTAQQNEELRKLLNGLDATGNAGRVKSQLIRSIDDSVTREGGTDVYGGARAAAKERFGDLDNPAVQKTLDTFGELGQGKTAQSFIKSQVVSAPIQDVKALVDTTNKIIDPAQKKQALESMKGGVLSYLKEKSVNPNSGQFSGAKLSDAMREIGDDKLRLVLGDADLGKLKSTAQAGLDATYQPAYSAVNSSNTAPALLSLTQKARAIPGVPLLVTDEAQKMAAKSGYNKQLGEALAAKPQGQLPELSPRAKQIGEMLLQMGIPTSQASLDRFRKRPNQNSQQ
jgi:hypothetical protein